MVWTVIGLAAGIGGTLAIIKPAKGVQTVVVAPPKATQGKPPTLYLEPLGPVKPVSSPMPAPDETKKSLPDLPIGPVPASPFGDANDLISQLPTAPAALKGSLPKMPMVPPEFIAKGNKSSSKDEPGSTYLNDIMEKGVPKPPPALRATDSAATPTQVVPEKGSCALITIHEAGGNPQTQAEEITAYATSLHGTVQTLVERGHGVSQKDRKPVVSGLLITLPSAALADFQKHLADGGTVVDTSTWSGAADARRVRLTQEANARIASLGSLREALLVTNQEDADAVKDVDEDIARAKKILEQLQTDSSTDAMTFVRIVFVSK